VRNNVSDHDFIWRLYVKGYSSYGMKKHYWAINFTVFTIVKLYCHFIFLFTECYRLDSGQPFMVFLVNDFTGVGRGGKGGPCPPWILKLLAKKGCFINFER